MGKLIPILMSLITVILLFHIAGFIPDTANGKLINFALHPESWKDSDFVDYAETVISLGAIVGIGIGTLFPNQTRFLMTASFTLLLFNLGWDILAILTVLSNQIGLTISLIIISPLMTGYIISIVEFFRGTD